MDPTVNFCSHCGARISLEIPAGDNRVRHVCHACDTIHYSNPRMVVGSLPVWEDKVLLCRRAIEPRRGFWTLPSGFMENGETLGQAATRETIEEACAHIELHELLSLVSVAHINQIHAIFRASLLTTEFGAGDETLEVRLFAEAEVPWKEIAFRSVRLALSDFFADRRRHRFDLHIHDLAPE